jgi:hypothetical protein
VLSNTSPVEPRSNEDDPADDGDPADDDNPLSKVGDPALRAVPVTLLAASLPLRADKTDGKLMCATGATDRSTVAAVAGIRNEMARAPVIRMVGINRSFFIGIPRTLLLRAAFCPRRGLLPTTG